jgi:glycosyltransferase involved in cell wall biosynthesis
MESIIQEFPQVQVWFAGPFKNILGEEEYLERLSPLIARFEKSGNWKFLGLLNPEQMAAFYPNLDILVLPSLNSTESFGLVQIEAMMNGIPVVASDLPGVRQPIKLHNFGKIFPVGDFNALSRAIIDLIRQRQKGKIGSIEIMKQYSPDFVAAEYENLAKEIYDSIRKV